MATKAFQKGEVIILEGSQGDRSYRIISGEVIICKESKRKGLIPIAKLGSGELFGEMYLLDRTGYRSATAIASVDTVVEVYTKGEMQDQLHALAPEIQTIMSSLTKRLKTTSQNYTFVRATKVSAVDVKESAHEESTRPYEEREKDGYVIRVFKKDNHA